MHCNIIQHQPMIALLPPNSRISLPKRKKKNRVLQFITQTDLKNAESWRKQKLQKVALLSQLSAGIHDLMIFSVYRSQTS